MKRYFIFIGLLFISGIPFTQMSYGDMPVVPGHHGARLGGQERQAPPRIALPNDESLREILSYKKELNLTDTQVDAIRGIRTDLIAENKSRVEAMITSQKELAEIMNQPDPDFAKADEKVKEISEKMVAVQTLPFNALEKAYKVLNTEQKNQLYVLKNQTNKGITDQPKPADSEPANQSK